VVADAANDSEPPDELDRVPLAVYRRALEDLEATRQQLYGYEIAYEDYRNRADVAEQRMHNLENAYDSKCESIDLLMRRFARHRFDLGPLVDCTMINPFRYMRVNT
jgi:hypothetical protein